MKGAAGLLVRFKSLLGLRGNGKKGAKPFAEDARAYRERMTRHCKTLKVPDEGRRVAFLVTPWLSTAVPFFSMECAVLAAESGARPLVIWDDANIVHNAETPEETAALREIIAAARSTIEVWEPAEEEPGATAPEELLFENFVRYARGERLAKARLAAEQETPEAFRRHYRRVYALLAKCQPDHLVIPGGIWGLSGMYLEAAQALKIPVTTFDSGTGLLGLSHSGVTAHYGDIQAAWQEHQPRVLEDAALRERVLAKALESLDNRIHGRDRFKLQANPKDPENAPPCDVLIPLNFRVDSAAMLRSRVFKGVEGWLEGILDWLESRPGVTAVIRQHPCERIERFKGSDNWGELLASRPSLNGRVRYVSAEEPINTYSLLQKCKVVVPYTSRVGVEAGLLGIPVVVATRAPYSEMDFVSRADDRAHFHALLDQAIEGKIPLKETHKTSAALAYALLEECGLLRTPFTPDLGNFRAWVKVPAKAFAALDSVPEFIDALLRRRPLPSLLFERNFLKAPHA